jgi:hypothetical protein
MPVEPDQPASPAKPAAMGPARRYPSGTFAKHPGDGANPERARCTPPEADARWRSLAEFTTKEIR